MNLQGTGVALVTPFQSNGKIDFDGLKRLVNYVVDGKVEYLVVLGTTAESATLSSLEKNQVVETVIQANSGRIPIVMGYGGNSTQELIEGMQFVDRPEISAVLSVSPYYNKPTQAGIYAHYMAFATACPKPVILYNVPGRTASNMTAATTIALANDHLNIIAVKEASGNIEQCMEIRHKTPKSFALISGDDNLTHSMLAFGAHGVISVVANVLPLQFSNMVRLGLANKLHEAAVPALQLVDFIQALFAEGNPAGAKSALEMLKVCGPTVRLPLVGVSNPLQTQLRSHLQSIGVL